MSMSFSYYVGPYFIISRDVDFDCEKWEDLLTDGRGEAGVREEIRILIPNYKLDRVSYFDQWTGEDEVISVTPPLLEKEKAAFRQKAADFLKECVANNVEVKEGWGVVPYFG